MIKYRLQLYVNCARIEQERGNELNIDKLFLIQQHQKKEISAWQKELKNRLSWTAKEFKKLQKQPQA